MKRIKLSHEARDDIRAALAWWAANRPKAPRLLRDELRSAFTLLSAQPLAGTVAHGAPKDAGIRFVLLRGTRHLVYYSVQDEDLEVLRVWHMSRAARPFTG